GGAPARGALPGSPTRRRRRVRGGASYPAAGSAGRSTRAPRRCRSYKSPGCRTCAKRREALGQGYDFAATGEADLLRRRLADVGPRVKSVGVGFTAGIDVAPLPAPPRTAEGRGRRVGDGDAEQVRGRGQPEQPVDVLVVFRIRGVAARPQRGVQNFPHQDLV